MNNSLLIHPISILKDNYVWTIIDKESRRALIVDPGEAKPVAYYLKVNQLKLCGILITHHHWDHTNGLTTLIEHEKTDIPVFAPAAENIPGATHPVSAGDTVAPPDFPLTFKVLGIPGHTLGHIAFYAAPMLFCGDTLFASGCGRIFEGTPDMMYASLQQLASLPDDTTIYCAHEYTLNNLRFASLVEPNNLEVTKRLAEVSALRDKNKPSLPTLLKEEKETNPFLRCDSPDVISAIASRSKTPPTDPVSIFTALRKWKDHF